MADRETKKEGGPGMAKGTKENIREEVQKVMDDVFEKGMLPKEAMGLTDGMVEGIYGHAYRLYNSGQYREASQLFRLLVMLDATTQKYMMGLSACYHLLGEYENALMTYSVAEILNPEDPMPCYHSSDCYARMGEMDNALEQLQFAEEKCGERAEYAHLKDRIHLTVDNLKKHGIKATDTDFSKNMKKGQKKQE
ncbi:MAG: CesD/SycD/LcrH family type III secretion system chaperone [Rickettsiales bacterium]|nr:CesD/SycD/LcrH family type III secretion system chaperone [Rickettsiales bacterium]